MILDTRFRNNGHNNNHQKSSAIRSTQCTNARRNERANERTRTRFVVASESVPSYILRMLLDTRFRDNSHNNDNNKSSAMRNTECTKERTNANERTRERTNERTRALFAVSSEPDRPIIQYYSSRETIPQQRRCNNSNNANRKSSAGDRSGINTERANERGHTFIAISKERSAP